MFRRPSTTRSIEKGHTRESRTIFLTHSGKYWGSTRPTSNADYLVEHRDAVIGAARAAMSIAVLESAISHDSVLNIHNNYFLLLQLKIHSDIRSKQVPNTEWHGL